MADKCFLLVCKKCQDDATVEELTSFMSVVSCIRCEVSEVLGHGTALTPMDHFNHYEAPLQRTGEWRN